jgi:hypothetical protein
MLPNPYLQYLRLLRRHETIPSGRMSLDLVRYRTESGLGGGEFVVLYSVLENRRVCVYVRLDGIGYNLDPTSSSRASILVLSYPEAEVTVVSSS